MYNFLSCIGRNKPEFGRPIGEKTQVSFASGPQRLNFQFEAGCWVFASRRQARSSSSTFSFALNYFVWTVVPGATLMWKTSLGMG
jgi:hypothetical protein